MCGQQDLHEARVRAKPFDFLDREVGHMRWHQQGGAQAWLDREPLGRLPVVERRGEGSGRIGVVDAVDRIGAVEDADLRAGRVQRIGA